MAAWVKVGERRLPSAQIEERAARAASALASLGIGASDVVAVCLRNDFPFLEVTAGAGLLGAYVTPVNWHNTAAEAGYVFEDCGAKAIVIHADLHRRLSDAYPPGVPVFIVETPADVGALYNVPADERSLPAGAKSWSAFIEPFAPYTGAPTEAPGAMIYTSGTTGKQKGVRRLPPTPEQSAATTVMIGQLFGTEGWNPEDIVAVAAGPLYHSTPNAWTPYMFKLGANTIIEPKFDAEGLLRTIQQEKVTHLLAVPTMFVRLLKLPEEVRAKYDVSTLRFVMHGAAPCPVEVKRAMIEWFGPVIWEHYGGTETGAVTLVNSEDWLAHPGTVGKPMEDAHLRILDHEGKPLPQGEIGEVATWRPTYPNFTYNKDDAKRQSADREGLVSLGDKGYIDADGFLYLCGRASDMIISGGVNIYPAEIEAELLKMPGVADCGVFGIPDEEFGEQVCAYVQPQPGVALTADEVRAFLKGKVANYKIPRTVEFSEHLPREDSGKIFKRKLREPYWDKQMAEPA